MTLFTYLGKEGAILRMVEAFLNHPSRFMHPVELSRATGLGVFEIRDRLEGCQALFVRLPRTPDGLVRYALASSLAGLDQDGIHALIAERARTERLTLTAGILVIAGLGFLTLITVAPAALLGLGS